MNNFTKAIITVFLISKITTQDSIVSWQGKEIFSPLKKTQRFNYYIDLLRQLQEIHSSGKIHGNIMPSTIMIQKKDEIINLTFKAPISELKIGEIEPVKQLPNMEYAIFRHPDFLLSGGSFGYVKNEDDELVDRVVNVKIEKVWDIYSFLVTILFIEYTKYRELFEKIDKKFIELFWKDYEEESELKDKLMENYLNFFKQIWTVYNKESGKEIGIGDINKNCNEICLIRKKFMGKSFSLLALIMNDIETDDKKVKNIDVIIKDFEQVISKITDDIILI